MDIYQIPRDLSLSGTPVGLGGCRNDGRCLDCCEYNISVFDGGSGEAVHSLSEGTVKVHHCSLGESNAQVLVQLQDLAIIHDDKWSLRIFLSGLREKRGAIFRSCTRSGLVDAGILANKAREAARASDPFGGVWAKCASYALADALFSANLRRPSPVHMMEITRGMEKNSLNETFSLVQEVLGVERASTSVLARMVKSSMGFSDMTENNGNSGIIKKKYEYLVSDLLLSDCYFYLGYVTRGNLMKVRNRLHKNPEYIHVLRVALDIESDPLIVERQAATLLQKTNEILSDLKEN